MIDLARTRSSLLHDIGVSNETLVRRVEGPDDDRFLELDEAVLTVRGGTPAELLPVLATALSRRFSGVSKKRLRDDLLYLLKKGIGNAYKWGHDRDPERSITVYLVVSRTGAVASVTDEGAGFDVARTVDKLLEGECYYTHGGSGFKNFRRTRSLVSYENSGRTLLIRFLDPAAARE